MTKSNKIPPLPYKYRKKFPTDNLNDILVENVLENYQYGLSKLIVLTADDEKLLFTRYKEYGCIDSFNIILLYNLKLVFSIAYPFRYLNIDLMDIIQEGNLGLIHAIRKFDPSLGYKFSTYATWWIRQPIIKELVRGNNDVEIPDYIVAMLNRIKRIKTDFVSLYDRDPSFSEIANLLYDVTVDEVKIYLSATSDIVYLDTEFNGNDFTGDSLKDYIVDRTIEDPIINVIVSNVRDILEDFIDTLPEREQYIMNHRFNLTDDTENVTLQEIGDTLGITRERVRQIESDCLVDAKKYIIKRGFSDVDMLI